MTKKDLFKIILKLYGLYSIIALFVQIPNIILYMSYDSNHDLDWLILSVPAMSVLVVYILLFQSEFLIRLFKLDQGYENNDSVKDTMNGQSISQIALVIISVFMIVSNLGDFITQIVFSFKDSISTTSLDTLKETFNPNPVNYYLMISSGLNLIFGFLLLTNYSRLSKWIDRINNKNAD